MADSGCEMSDASHTQNALMNAAGTLPAKDMWYGIRQVEKYAASERDGLLHLALHKRFWLTFAHWSTWGDASTPC